MTRDEFIAGLREAADFLQAHPELPCSDIPLTLNIFVHAKEDLTAIARSGRWNKQVAGNYFYLQRQVGALSYEVNIQRDKVCRRVVTGTTVIPAKPEEVIEQVEWICEESMLATEAEGVR